MKSALIVMVLFLATSMTVELYAQSKEAEKSDKSVPTSLQSVNPPKYYGPKRVKKKKTKAVTHDAQNEYYDRIEKTWREQEKREKSMERGEATDYMKPPYFGHKKPPKIRPIEKRKYCKICGIRH